MPLLCLLAAIILLSTVAPAMKLVFLQGQITPLGMVTAKLTAAAIILVAAALFLEERELQLLNRADLVRLSLLGLLGVGLPHAIAAWGLQLTTATHYILILTLAASFTSLFGLLHQNEKIAPMMLLGLLVSFAGGLIAVSENLQQSASNLLFGDALVFLFMILMSAQLLLHSATAKRCGILTANSVMFGSSALAILTLGMLWPGPARERLSVVSLAWLMYIGVATGAVFLLRYLALRSVTPAVARVLQYLAPVSAVLLASVFLGEALELHTIIGGVLILSGVELVRRA
ncbi:MAG: DMT family transporter [Nitrospiraceae bacterium]